MNASATSRRHDTPFRSTILPSQNALALEQMSVGELETAFVRGATPDLDALVGWEFRGINHKLGLGPVRFPLAPLLGIKKFVKGFYRTPDEAGKVMGYNSPVKGNALDGRWHVRWAFHCSPGRTGGGAGCHQRQHPQGQRERERGRHRPLASHLPECVEGNARLSRASTPVMTHL